jgi:hypothetical protein
LFLLAASIGKKGKGKNKDGMKMIDDDDDDDDGGKMGKKGSDDEKGMYGKKGIRLRGLLWKEGK